MRLHDPKLHNVFDARANTPGHPETWAPAHNVLFEERVTATRQQSYEQHLDPGDLDGSHNDYFDNRVRPPTSETFTGANADAFIPESEHPVELLRIEDATQAVRRVYGAANQKACDNLNADIGTLHDRNSGRTARVRLEDFIAQLQKNRDHRPVFAAPVSTAPWLPDAPDWEDYIAALGVPVLPKDYPEKRIRLLLRYTARDVYDRAKPPEPHHFAAPTAIDSDLHKYFFPSPANATNAVPSWGRIMDLDDTNGTGGAPHAEVVHPPFRFAPAHLVSARCLDLSQRTRPAIEHQPRDVRNAHLDRVRQATGRQNFGWKC